MTQRIDEAVHEYAQRLAEGTAPDAEEFLASHPEIADRIRERILHLCAAQKAFGPFVETPDAPEVAAVGRSLGGFRISREIGRGGMGVVYLAEEIALRRSVALKVLPAPITLHPDAIARFRREASIAARLRHPGIV